MEPSSDKRQHPRHGLAFAYLAFLSAFMIGHLLYNPPSFSTLGGWVVVGATIYFSAWAIFCFFAMRNNWTDEQADQVTMRTLGYVVLAPIAIIVVVLVAVLAGVWLFSAFGWLATIPS